MKKLPCFLSSVRFRILSLIIPYGLVLILYGTAWGEKPKEERILLSLPELINMAIANSPEIGGIQSDIASTRSDLDQVKAAYYPQLETTAVVGPVPDAKEPLIVNGRITDPSPPVSLSSIGIFGRWDLTATQPLFTFGKLSNRKEAASRGVKAKEFQIDEKKGQVALRIKELYYSLILAHAGVGLANESGDFFEEVRRHIHRLLELKSSNVSESDLYRLDAYLADTARLRAQAEKGVKVAYFALKSQIRLPPSVEFDLTEKTLSMKKISLAGLESYLQEASAKRPEFKQLGEALAAQQSQVKAAISDLYPSFFAALQGSMAGAPGREAVYNQYLHDDFNHYYIGAVAGLKWNFDFGLSRAKVDKMRAEVSKLQNTKAFAEMNIPIEVVRSYQEHLEWREAANSFQQAATASRKWILTSLSEFDMGVGTAFDMLNAIDKYGQNQGKYFEAVLHSNLSLDELEYAAGMKTW